MRGTSVQIIRTEQKAMSSAFKRLKARKGVKTKEAKIAKFTSRKQEMLRR